MKLKLKVRMAKGAVIHRQKQSSRVLKHCYRYHYYYNLVFFVFIISFLNLRYQCS